MARVIGQIGPLKHIRNRLNQEGLGQFNTLKELNSFLENYDTEKQKIRKKYGDEVNLEINRIKEGIKHSNLTFEDYKKAEDEALNKNVYLPKRKIVFLTKKEAKKNAFITFLKAKNYFLIAKINYTHLKYRITQNRKRAEHNKKINTLVTN